jgi:hypothetical protein
MKQKVFQRWQLDQGVSPIPDGVPLPPTYAIAYYDYLDRLYRAVVRVKECADAADDNPGAFGTYVVDYYCDPHGRVLQKRYYGETGDVELIVDVEYDPTNDRVTETAWNPSEDLRKAVKRRMRPDERR